MTNPNGAREYAISYARDSVNISDSGTLSSCICRNLAIEPFSSDTACIIGSRVLNSLPIALILTLLWNVISIANIVTYYVADSTL